MPITLLADNYSRLSLSCFSSYGGATTRAYYQAALSFTTIVGYSSSLAFAMYPKLLAKTCPDEQVGTSFRTVLMLAIPLSTITMVMSTSFLSVLNISYSVAWPVLIALTINTLVSVITSFYSSLIMGREGFDAEGKISLRKLVRSKIFTVFSLGYIQAAIALPLVYYVLTQVQVAGTAQAAVVRYSNTHWRPAFNLYWTILVLASFN